MSPSATSTALIRTRSFINTVETFALQQKATGGLGSLMDLGGGGALQQLSNFRDQTANRQRYALYRGHVYSALHALACAAAGQPAHVGKMTKPDAKRKPGGKKDAHITRRMTASARQKAAASQREVMDGHPLADNLNYPNRIQTRWQFTYSFVANLGLTGWAFIVAGKKDEGKGGGYEWYSVPTTWVHPDHEKGAFSRFKIYNPREVNSADREWIPGNQVGFAYFPNPADPMAALAPSAAQNSAIRIDEKIQSSQEMFFDNGIFPSVIVTVGSNPHPDIPGGVRPRLSPQQRRQVHAAIKKTIGGVANYGNPAIVDGLIEKIEKLSMTQNEIGWEKSEKAVRSRILSAFGVHPFMLGEEVAGSYAQSYNVKDIFYGRVNIFLDMLSVVMTGFVGPDELIDEEEDLLVWWEECKATDPSMEQGKWDKARDRDDVSQNEYRSHVLGLPPDEDEEEAVINKTLAAAVTKIAEDSHAGAITPEQAVAMLKGLGIPDDMADEIAGEGPPEPPPGQPGMVPCVPGQPPMPGQQGAMQGGQPGQFGGQPTQPKPPKPKKPPKPEAALEDASLQLEAAVQALNNQPLEIMQKLVDRSDLTEYDEKAWCPGASPPDNSCPPGGGGRGKPKPGVKPPAGGAVKPSNGNAKPAAKPTGAGRKPPKPATPPGQKPKPGEPDKPLGQDHPIVRNQRRQALDTAKMLGFKPTSKDKWINEQQGIEFMQKHNDKMLVAKAAREGHTPKDSNDPVSQAMARLKVFPVKSIGGEPSGPKLNAESPKVSKVLTKIKQPPKTPEQRNVVMGLLKHAGVKKSDIWSNWKQASKDMMDYHLDKFKHEAVSKIEGTVKGIMDKIFSNSALIARVSAQLLGEKQF